MTRSMFIYLCIIAITIHNTEQLTCGYNEIQVDCPANCSSDHCPTYDRQVQNCPRPKECGEPECRCRFNTRRLPNGTCVPIQDCPPFECRAPNTEYVSCPPYCPSDECSQATPDGRCPYFGNLFFVVECVPKCRCIRGYWKNNGKCVPYSECPKMNSK